MLWEEGEREEVRGRGMGKGEEKVKDKAGREAIGEVFDVMATTVVYTVCNTKSHSCTSHINHSSLPQLSHTISVYWVK